jgi:hypothetical protein
MKSQTDANVMMIVDKQIQSEPLTFWEKKLGEKAPIKQIIYRMRSPKYLVKLPSEAGEKEGKHMYSV